MNTKTIALFLIILLAVGGGSFYGGMKYSESQMAAKFANRGAGNFQPGTNNATGTKNGTRAAGNMIVGEITAKDDNSITVKSRDGNSRIIFVSESTQASKQASASLNDLVIGEQVNITGTTDASGNTIAKSVQIMSSETPAGQESPKGELPVSPAN